jgi:cytochrome c
VSWADTEAIGKFGNRRGIQESFLNKTHTARHRRGGGCRTIGKAMEIAGQKVFADRCAVCHAQKVGARPLGPSLRGVVGRPAASVAGFPYSDALKKSGLTWTDDNLRAWIADPSHTVPGTLMPHVSLSDPAEQLYVIAYLKTSSGKAAR